MITTLNQIRECEPCKEGWEKLLKGLNKTKEDDEPLKILRILEINGFDALWTLRSVKGYDKELRLFSLDNAKSVRHLIPEVELEKYDKVLKAIKDYAHGKATLEELKEALASAWELAGELARVLAGELAGELARESAKESAKESANSLAKAKAWESARESAWESARASAHKRFKEFLEELETKKNFKVLQESPNCNFTELWNETFSTSLGAKNKIVSLKDKFKEGTKLSILGVKEEYTIQTEVKSFNKLKRI